MEKVRQSGEPIIGNNIYMGLNSTSVKNITNGSDLMIAINTVLDFDAPDRWPVWGALVLHINAYKKE